MGKKLNDKCKLCSSKRVTTHTATNITKLLRSTDHWNDKMVRKDLSDISTPCELFLNRGSLQLEGSQEHKFRRRPVTWKTQDFTENTRLKLQFVISAEYSGHTSVLLARAPVVYVSNTVCCPSLTDRKSLTATEKAYLQSANVADNIPNQQHRTAEEGWSSNLVVGWGAETSSS